MNKKFIIKHWYASAYEQFENQTNDVEFLLGVLREQTDGTPQNILEAACGGGRIAVPLAQAGHDVTGFDADEHMLLRCYRKMSGLPNITCYQADALEADWGTGFDVVVLAGNILINIETGMDYKKAQEIFIRKAAAALRSGGYLYMDYDQHSDASAVKFFNRLGESSCCFKGTLADDLGTSGKIVSYGNIYNPVTQICVWNNHMDLTANNGERIVESTTGHKHIPSLTQVCGWLADAGLTVEKTYKNYTGRPLDEHDKKFARATIWAKKT
ncbi:MAG: class I SAM-dependent methyltransferase [Oscillospiraceae bacterium]|nr:class I SAM-dependent methyltransferase [Oscillospiraceae bacterium]